MPAAVFKSQKSISQSGVTIFCVVGTRRLQGELISYYLEQEIGVKCLLRGNIREIRVLANDTSNEELRLIFWDCQGKDPEELLLELEHLGEQVLSKVHLVLINVARDFGSEEKLVWKGVRGFLYEQDPLDCLHKGISAIIQGEMWLSRKVVTKCILEAKYHKSPDQQQLLSLTRREVEILAHLATWATNEEIADKLCISPHTVKNHLQNIFRKIKAPNRRQAALWATRNLERLIPKY